MKEYADTPLGFVTDGLDTGLIGYTGVVLPVAKKVCWPTRRIHICVAEPIGLVGEQCGRVGGN